MTLQPIGPAVRGNRGGGDQLDLRVVEDLLQAPGRFRVRIFFGEGGDFLGIGVVHPLQLAARFEQAIRLAVNMPVIEVRPRRMGIPRV